MRDYRPIILWSALVLPAVPLPAAGQIFKGRIVEVESGAPIAGVQLIAFNSHGLARLRGFTDNDGRFVLDVQQEGEYVLHVSHLGHVAYETGSLWVERNAATDVLIRMGTDAIPLEPIFVVGVRGAEAGHMFQFHERRLDPGQVGGYFMTREDIEHRPNATPAQLLLGVPGVTLRRLNNAASFTLDRSEIRLSGGKANGCRANVYVDGAPVQQAAGHSVDDLLDQTQIAGVEVYPRSMTAPVEYQMHRDCGVVLFWTRRPGAGNRPPTLFRKIGGGVVVVGLFAWVFSGIIG